MAVFTVGRSSCSRPNTCLSDRIAPDHLSGMYYGAQNLSNLGAALGLVLCGLVLASLPAYIDVLHARDVYRGRRGVLISLVRR